MMDLNYMIADEWMEMFAELTNSAQTEFLQESFSQGIPSDFIEEIDFLELVVNHYEYLKKEKQYDKIVELHNVINEHNAELFGENKFYVDEFVAEIYIFRNEEELIKESLNSFLEEPSESIEELIPLVQKLGYANHSELAQSICENVYKTLKNEKEFTDGSEENFTRLLRIIKMFLLQALCRQICEAKQPIDKEVYIAAYLEKLQEYGIYREEVEVFIQTILGVEGKLSFHTQEEDAAQEEDYDNTPNNEALNDNASNDEVLNSDHIKDIKDEDRLVHENDVNNDHVNNNNVEDNALENNESKDHANKGCVDEGHVSTDNGLKDGEDEEEELFDTLLSLFCIDVLYNKNINFATSVDIWTGAWQCFSAENTSGDEPKGDLEKSFKLNKESLKDLITDGFGLLSNLKAYTFAAVWGFPYVYDFLLKYRLVKMADYKDALECINNVKMQLIEGFCDELWQYHFVHTWERPDSLSAKKFFKEKELFNWVFVEQVDIEDYLATQFSAKESAADKIFLLDAEQMKKWRQNKAKTIRKVKVGRNDPCPCGSGKKYKKCCGK